MKRNEMRKVLWDSVTRYWKSEGREMTETEKKKYNRLIEKQLNEAYGKPVTG